MQLTTICLVVVEKYYIQCCTPSMREKWIYWHESSSYKGNWRLGVFAVLEEDGRAGHVKPEEGKVAHWA